MEKELYGIDHQEIGHAISIKWKLPLEFSNVMRHHHEDAKGAQYESLMKLVRTADRFSGSPNSATDRESFILLKEKDMIAKEMENIMNILRLE